MSRKRIHETINPQVAVHDYLSDLLQQPLSSSPLDRLLQEEQENERKKLEQKNKKTKVRTTPLEVDKHGSFDSALKHSEPQTHHTLTQHNAAYSERSSQSLASQRLEKKRALGRAPEKQFREPLQLKSSLALSRMLKAVPSDDVAESERVAEKVMPVTQNVVVEQVEAEKSTLPTQQTADDKELTPLNKKLSSTSHVALDQHKPSVAKKALLSQEGRLKPEDVVEKNIDDSLAESAEPIDHWLENGRPNWAQDRFECLIFTVAGLKLAVPLVALGAIHSMDQELTPLVGRPSWFLGLLPVAARNIRVVDSAQWIMPERYNDEVKDNYRFVIRLDNSEWGMACDSVAQSFSISPEEVRWRTDRGKRPWLAGTVIDHMCALMDVAAVSRLLDTAEKTNLSPI